MRDSPSRPALLRRTRAYVGAVVCALTCKATGSCHPAPRRGIALAAAAVAAAAAAAAAFAVAVVVAVVVVVVVAAAPSLPRESRLQLAADEASRGRRRRRCNARARAPPEKKRAYYRDNACTFSHGFQARVKAWETCTVPAAGSPAPHAKWIVPR
eukprot:scaffold4423_cov344-Prasinococcus_capsulatus_cf.AAC.9